MHRYHSAALRSNGQIYSWGLNQMGQLGHANRQELYSAPTLLDGLEGRQVPLVLNCQSQFALSRFWIHLCFVFHVCLCAQLACGQFSTSVLVRPLSRTTLADQTLSADLLSLMQGMLRNVTAQVALRFDMFACSCALYFVRACA